MQEFVIGEFTFRPKQMKATEILALETIINFNDVDKAMYMFDQILERLEVKVKDVWVPVKQKGSDDYMPVCLKTDLHMTYELCTKFMKLVLEPVFLKSEESKKSQ